jgi:hypothetical protein
MLVKEQWEYKLLVGQGLPDTLRDQDNVEFGKLNAELLNKLGKEGWEVCSHTLLPLQALTATLILKRRLVS